MKKLSSLFLALVALAVVSVPAYAAKPGTCATIKDGTILDSANNPIKVGYDEFGYNYDAHMFNGTYDSSDRVLDGLYWGDPNSVDYADDKLMMKWSDAWIANVDCNGDHKLDRGLVDGVVNGSSMGWLTNHLVGDYTDGDGVLQKYTEFTKIVWTGPGSPLWNEFTIVEDVLNDPAAGMHGLNTKLGNPGLGLMDHWTTL